MTCGAIINCLSLIAVRDVEVWGRFDHERPGIGTSELIVIGSIVLLLAGTLAWQILRRRHQREFLTDSASKLFGELCRAHRLDRSSRRLLKKLAAERGINNEAELFVEPHYFDTTNLTATLKSSAVELRQLRHKLFD